MIAGAVVDRYAKDDAGRPRVERRLDGHWNGDGVGGAAPPVRAGGGWQRQLERRHEMTPSTVPPTRVRFP